MIKHLSLILFALTLSACGGAADPEADTGSTDTGSTDTGSTDTGSTDTGSTDTGSTDTGSTDTGETDTGETDTGETDTGETDTGETDTGETDTGETDTGETDTGETDTGETDTGETDTGETDTGETDTGETDTDETDTGETDPETVSNPVLNYDASPLSYFAIKHGSGEWQKLDNTTHSIEVTDSKGDISIVTACDRSDASGISRGFKVKHLRITESLVTIDNGCESSEYETITLASEQASLSLDEVSIDKLIEAEGSSNYEGQRAFFSDLSGPKTIVASAYNSSTGEAYLYRQYYSQLDSDNTYTLDFLGEDAVKLASTVITEVNGFTYSYDYHPVVTSSWSIQLGRYNDVQWTVPTSFIQEGDLFLHRYYFGSNSRINMISENQATITNPLSTLPVEYTSSDFTISTDERSLSFTPKSSPITSLEPIYHRIYYGQGSGYYEVDASRFSESGNTLTLVDFNSLPDYSGDTPEGRITSPDVNSYFDNNGELLKSGYQWLSIYTAGQY